MLRRRTDAASWQGTSPPAQPCDEGACPGELLFVKRRAWRIATIAHCFDRLIDLAERSRRHGGVLPPLSKEHQSESLVAKSPGPVERVTLRGVFFQRSASLKSAMPRLFWATAQSRGMRSRVVSFSASR